MDAEQALLRLGQQLVTVVIKIAKRHSRSPSKALREYCLCTNSHNVSNFEDWFRNIAQRYTEEKNNSMTAEFKATATRNVIEVLESSFPQGCKSCDQLPDAFEAVLGLIDFEGLQTETTLAFARAIAASPRGVRTKWTVTAIAASFVNGPLADSRVRPLWWTIDRPTAVHTHRVGLRVVPPTLLIEYSLPSEDKIRHRRLHLDTMFRPSGSVVALAKKVHQSIAFTGLTLERVQRLLTDLQRLASPTGDPDVEAPNKPSTSSTASDVKKADLGLLYRDPKNALANVDLQDADDVTIREFKNKMDEEFLSRKLKPGDPGYVYDVRKQFKPTAKSEWDSDDD